MQIKTAKGATADIDDRIAESQGLERGQVVSDSVFLNLILSSIQLQLREQDKKEKKHAEMAKRKD